jgi:hypothetical protein
MPQYTTPTTEEYSDYPRLGTKGWERRVGGTSIVRFMEGRGTRN